MMRKLLVALSALGLVMSVAACSPQPQIIHDTVTVTSVVPPITTTLTTTTTIQSPPLVTTTTLTIPPTTVTVTPTMPTPPSTATGYGRANPAPIGTSLTTKVNYFSVSGQARITLVQIVRGADAWNLIKAANMFNSAPAAGHEYILARIRFEFLTADTPGAQYDISGSQFTAVSASGKDYDVGFVVEPAPELDAKLYANASQEGWATFDVAIADVAPLLTFGRDYRGLGGVWWQLY